jgi:cytochrome d ubiquinol oxidase subunit II
VDYSSAGDATLFEVLRVRTLLVGVVTGAIVLSAVLPLRYDAPTLSRSLHSQAAIFVVLSAIAGALTVWLLSRRRPAIARLTAVTAVGSLVIG